MTGKRLDDTGLINIGIIRWLDLILGYSNAKQVEFLVLDKMSTSKFYLQRSFNKLFLLFCFVPGFLWLFVFMFLL